MTQNTQSHDIFKFNLKVDRYEVCFMSFKKKLLQYLIGQIFPIHQAVSGGSIHCARIEMSFYA